MKVRKVIIFVLLLLQIMGCNNNKSGNKEGAWYVISDNNEIIGEALFSKHDVDVIRIDSSYIEGSNKLVYAVEGRFKPDATVRLSQFTEENIGKRLGFVLDGKVITSPVIEQKNEEGGFLILSVPLFTDKAEAMKTYESLLVDK